MRLARIGSCGHVRGVRLLVAPQARRLLSALLLGADWAVWPRIVVQVVGEGGGELLDDSGHVSQVLCCFGKGVTMMKLR